MLIDLNSFINWMKKCSKEQPKLKLVKIILKGFLMVKDLETRFFPRLFGLRIAYFSNFTRTNQLIRINQSKEVKMVQIDRLVFQSKEA